MRRDLSSAVRFLQDPLNPNSSFLHISNHFVPDSALNITHNPSWNEEINNKKTFIFKLSHLFGGKLPGSTVSEHQILEKLNGTKHHQDLQDIDEFVVHFPVFIAFIFCKTKASFGVNVKLKNRLCLQAGIQTDHTVEAGHPASWRPALAVPEAHRVQQQVMERWKSRWGWIVEVLWADVGSAVKAHLGGEDWNGSDRKWSSRMWGSVTPAGVSEGSEGRPEEPHKKMNITDINDRTSWTKREDQHTILLNSCNLEPKFYHNHKLKKLNKTCTHLELEKKEFWTKWSTQY